MAGIATLAELYLGAEPRGVTTDGDRLLIHLTDGRLLALPLAFVSQLEQTASLSAESRLLILSTPPQIDDAQVTARALIVTLRDGRVLSSPLHWFPRLWYAMAAERAHFQIVGDEDVIHWPDLDEDIDLMRLFSGGASLESEQSVQEWLAERSVAAFALHEQPSKYTTDSTQQ